MSKITRSIIAGLVATGAMLATILVALVAVHAPVGCTPTDATPTEATLAVMQAEPCAADGFYQGKAHWAIAGPGDYRRLRPHVRLACKPQLLAAGHAMPGSLLVQVAGILCGTHGDSALVLRTMQDLNHPLGNCAGCSLVVPCSTIVEAWYTTPADTLDGWWCGR